MEREYCLGSIREEAAPKHTIKAYKLMRLVDGELYPLYIDRAAPVALNTWYNADSPDFAFLKTLPAGYCYLIANHSRVIERTKRLLGMKDGKQILRTTKDVVAEIEAANAKRQRWIWIEATADAQRRFFGESRRYWNLGINGSGTPYHYSMRPGWHAGSLPVMRQVWCGDREDKKTRDNFVFTECELSADIDYNDEAKRNPDNDLPDRLPVDGWYLKATNADKKAAQADSIGWYIAGAIKINRIISDGEAHAIIDRYNAQHPDDEPVQYQWPRESGKMFNADTMQLEGAQVDTFIDIVKDMENKSIKKAGTNPANLRQHNAEPSVETLFGRKSSLLGSSNNTFSQIDIDEAKVEKNTQSAKNNLKKYKNGDYKPFDIPLKKLKLESLGRVLLWLRRLFKMIYHGQSSYNYYTTPKGLLNFRISNHKANPKNFRANNADFNVSVYVALLERNYNSDADVDYMEYRYSREDYEAHAEEIVEAIIKGFDHALQTGEFIDYSGYATPLHHKGLSGANTPIDERKEAHKVLKFMLKDCFGQDIPANASVIGDYIRITTYGGKNATKRQFMSYLIKRNIADILIGHANISTNETTYDIPDGQLNKVKQAVGYKEGNNLKKEFPKEYIVYWNSVTKKDYTLKTNYQQLIVDEDKAIMTTVKAGWKDDLTTIATANEPIMTRETRCVYDRSLIEYLIKHKIGKVIKKEIAADYDQDPYGKIIKRGTYEIYKFDFSDLFKPTETDEAKSRRVRIAEAEAEAEAALALLELVKIEGLAGIRKDNQLKLFEL
ncbi:MAG: hypothetical protein J5651_00550 [Salinivirgaceae bacterium]|nr:hypothetical protein [Salinivirgaceae bacterium]